MEKKQNEETYQNAMTINKEDENLKENDKKFDTKLS